MDVSSEPPQPQPRLKTKVRFLRRERLRYAREVECFCATPRLGKVSIDLR